MKRLRAFAAIAPAVALTAVSMVLTLAVVVAWLGAVMPVQVAAVVGIGLDGSWLATLAYERRLAAQGDHSRAVTAVGWGFGAVATGVLVAHALTSGDMAAWLAVAWLPLAAKALWLVHGLWERTALTPAALETIAAIRQSARDGAAVARAQLAAQAGTEETRLTAVTAAGARVARVQAQTAKTLSKAWEGLESARSGDGTSQALTSVTERVTPGVTPSWTLPVWGEFTPVAELSAAPEEAALSDVDLDAIVNELRLSETPPLSYRELALRFRSAGHSAGETRLRASWHRVTAPPVVTAQPITN
jgi:hypothetical protein